VFFVYEEFAIPSVLTALATAYLTWMWFDTYYIIEDSKLLYKSALLSGSICIDSIFEVTRSTYQYSGKKPSLAYHGLVVKYNRWDDIYLSPKQLEQFTSALKVINPKITVID